MLIAFVALYFGYRRCQKPDLGDKLTFGKSEIFYKDGATREEAQELGEFLQLVGYFVDPNRATVLLGKKDDHYLVSFVVREGTEKDEQSVRLMRDLGGQISEEVFDGAVVEVRLLDGELELKRALEPVDGTDPDLWLTPPMIVGLDLENARKSALYRKYEPHLRAAVDETSRELGLECGWEVVTAIRSVMVRRYLQPDEALLLVVRGVPRAMLVPCLEAAAAQPGREMAVSERESYTEVREGELQILMRWLDADSFLVEVDDQSGPVVAPDRLERRVTAEVGLDDHPRLAAKAKLVDPAAVAWLAWAPRPLAVGGPTPEDLGAHASVLLDAGLRLQAEMHTLNEAQAEAMVRWVAHMAEGSEEFPSMAALRSHLKVEVEGRSIFARIALDEAQFDQLATTVAADEKLHQLLSAE